MAEIIRTEICIVGAGPAGATTSLFLSKMQIPHVIVDAATFPRDKVCGDALDLKVMRVLNHYDPTLVEREIIPNAHFAKAWGLRLIRARRKPKDWLIHNRKRTYPFFFVAKRGYFDNFLAEKIPSPYARFLQGTKITGLKKVDNLWQITASQGDTPLVLEAKLVVGADGDHSAVLRAVGQRKIDREHYAAGLRQYWKGISGLSEQGFLEFYFPRSLPLAYLWIFPLPNGEANVGCGLASKMLSQKKIDLKKLLHRLITEDPALAERFRHATPLEKPMGWGLPMASQRREAAGDGYLLVGDAAAAISPSTGEGIGTAMLSGYIAAHFIQRAVGLKTFDKSVFKNYTREISKRMERDVRVSNLTRLLPSYLYHIFINTLISLFSERYFNRQLKGWVHTARDKKIAINF